MSVDITKVSCCLITKDSVYPPEILDHLLKYPFGEILIRTHCPNSAGKDELFKKAKYDLIYYQDDDAICPVSEIIEQAEPNIITCAMKPGHLEAYKNIRIACFGWGSIIPRSTLDKMPLYIEEYGIDDLYLREYDRILTSLNFPQKRIDAPIVDLPSAYAVDRYSTQEGHYNNIPLMEKRCDKLVAKVV